MSCSLLSATHPHPTFRFFWFENTQESVYVAKFKLALLLFHENNRGANLLWCMWGFLLLFLWSIHCPHRYVHKKSLVIAKSESSETGYGIDQNRSTSRFLCVCMCVCVRVDHHVREDCSTIGPRTHQWWQPYPSLQCMYPSYLGSILMYCWLPPVNPLALVPFFRMPKRFGKRNNKTRDPRQWRKWSISQPFINFMCKLEMMICTCAKEKILLLKRLKFTCKWCFLHAKKIWQKEQQKKGPIVNDGRAVFPSHMAQVQVQTWDEDLHLCKGEDSPLEEVIMRLLFLCT